jgi:hypothetical protein
MKLNILTKNIKKALLVMAGCSALPFLSNVAFAETNHEQKKQLSGYIGKLSKQAISSAMYTRLKSNVVLEGVNRNTGDDDTDLKNRVEYWHEIALDTIALDHTPADDGDAPTNQAGPARTSRAMAMVHIAMFEAMNAIDEQYESYTGKSYPGSIDDDASIDAAVAQAAHDTLLALYPDHSVRLAEALDDDLDIIYDNDQRSDVNDGIEIGEYFAEAILNNRDNDNSEIAEPYFGEGGAVADGSATTYFGTPINGGGTTLGEWQLDPNTPEYSGDYTLALGAYWGTVTPFSMDTGYQFRAPVPPLPGSDEYQAAYDEVSALGGSPDNIDTPTTGGAKTKLTFESIVYRAQKRLYSR